ncbi:MAG TPA: hypothetical protein DEQ80_09800 [Anaerolinea thermolimosa]|uniref:Diacylglycerol glucosyltransferase N-terminal domain-containing protein n=2 Tax=Anaerolinea thermolimosa TaxID=229919 RepID=A0A3D1JHT7_9CHLR|nr:UDP-N-acetylglucosamine:LPS N-acetylglucosamine transferase [Anaerolinea thermolimosa]HCE18139.1 hypothetical protein [Anaerolinea thermolimosa]
MAARAIRDALLRLEPQLQVALYDPIERVFPFFPQVGNTGLAVTTRYLRFVYGKAWRGGKSPWVRWVSQWEFWQRSLPEFQDGVVLATHVVPLRMALHARQRYKKNWRVYGVVTDFGAHGYWPIEGVDGYFVAHEDVREDFIKRGKNPEKIHPTGIPLRKGFEPEEGWPALRGGGVLQVGILAGGVYSGAYTSMEAWLRNFWEALEPCQTRVRFTVVTGNRETLRERVRRLSRRTQLEVDVQGFVSDMVGFMRGQDLLFSKPGGLTVAESLACGLPLGCLRAGAGAESANVSFLARHGLFLDASSPELAARLVWRAMEDTRWLLTLKDTFRAIGKPDAAEQVARMVLGGLE